MDISDRKKQGGVFGTCYAHKNIHHHDPKGSVFCKNIHHIRDFLNPISGSRIPFPGNISHTRDFTISHFRESYPTYGNLLHPTLGSHIPNVGIRNIPF